ncbi:MAG TPA: hypothetical protein VFT64_01230 [Rickettsiales bacterium]|nr:hypothetical protein [Rickettsiales bacterium]
MAVKLRNSIIKSIYNHLEISGFSLRDFKINTDHGQYLAHIVFIPKPEYEFIITEKDYAAKSIASIVSLTTQPEDLKLTTVESPGEYKTREVTKHSTIHECINRIRDWCQNIKEDLATRIPLQKELDEFEIEIEQRINDAAGNSQEHFSESEVNNLNNKLDNFLAKFEELEKAKTITEKELKEIKAELERLKRTLPMYQKDIWYKTAGHSLLDMTKKVFKTKEGREFLFDAAKKFFLE